MLKITRPGEAATFGQIDIGDVGATVEQFESIGESPERFSAFLSPCCLKEKRERHCRPTARAPFLDCIKESDRFLVSAR
jgi:hypothetical protein